jgi:BASS family bile acid:Na+ symporter
MVAATDGLLPGTTWLYFALSQFPIYLSPQLLKPVVRKLSEQRLTAPCSDPATNELMD